MHDGSSVSIETEVQQLARVPRIARTVFENRELRRVELAFAAFNAAEWGVWIAMLVYAYRHGGATTAGLVALAQLVPAAIVAPFAAGLADRRPPARVLTLGYVLQAAALTATAAALLTGAPPLLAYALAAVAATAVTITRPAQAAVLPALARTPDELTATNAVSGWIESASVLAAPAATGVLLSVSGPGSVFGAMAALVLGGAILTAGVAGPAAGAQSSGGVLAESLQGFKLLGRERGAGLLVGILSVQYLVIGALDVLFVVLAISVLDLGGSGAGYLNAAFGGGGVLGVAATAALVGRPRLVPPLLAGAAVWSIAFVALGARPSTIAAFVLLALAGAGRSVLDVAGRTLLQRLAPGDVLARVFGVLESLSMAGLAVGSILAPALVGLVGARGAVACAGAILPLALLACFARLRAVDAEATAPIVEIALLRSVPLFAPLGAPVLESLARSLRPLEAPAGTAVVRAGDAGDLYYAIADGTVSVSVEGVRVAELGRGEGFGELALLADVPRTATVTATSDVRLYALGKDAFLTAVTGHAASRREADRLVHELLPEEPISSPMLPP